MPDLLPWDAPAVFTYDLSGQTRGGGTVFSDETVYVNTPYNFEGMPLS